MSITRELFTEKFRPKNLEQLIVPDRIKNELNKGLVQNLLLYGTQGTGKTSTLFILADRTADTTLYVDASKEGNIDVIRDKIGKFCSTISLEHGREKLKRMISVQEFLHMLFQVKFLTSKILKNCLKKKL